jgi:F-type H+-transporting ATPase subunit epsilon
MAGKQLQVDIISPERPLYSGPATSVVAPAHDGELGILPSHAPMVAAVGIGEVRITTPTGVDYFAVSGGFLQTSDDKVILISEDAKAPDDIDEDTLGPRLDAVQNRLSSMITVEQRDEANAERRWLETLARVARHSRKGMAHQAAMAKSGLTMQMDKADAMRRQQEGK